MQSARFLTLLEADGARVFEVASKGLDAPIPPCPGWTVEDVLTHLAHVYLHKVICMQTMARPDPWPPDLSGREPVALLGETFDALLDELRTRGPDAPSYTWYEPDQSVGFWYRRMAQETAVHRVDVELAHDMLTPIDAELAADGIDEVLAIMLAGDWSDEPVEDADGRALDVRAGGRTWRVVLGRTRVDVTETTDVTKTADAAGAGPGTDAGATSAGATSVGADAGATSVGADAAGTSPATNVGEARAGADAGAGRPAATGDGGRPDVILTGDPSNVLLWMWGRLPADVLDVSGDAAVLAAFRRRLALATQ